MKSTLLGSGILIIVVALAGAGCSGDQPAANTNAGTNANITNINVANSSAGSANVAAEKREYPAEVAEEFMKSCEESGSPPAFCTCMFEKVQKEYTFEEFSTIETKISAGEPPEDFVEFTGKARAACTK